MKHIQLNQYLIKLKVRHSQQGVVLPITLIALLLLMIASVALIRSTETNLLVSGNLAFKRDVIANNYYATIQPTNESGIPTILLDIDNFDGNFSANNIVDEDAQITIRYLIDRMCLSTGKVTISKCARATQNTDIGGDANNLALGKASGNDTPVYRVSIRATGPRNTEAFFQYTLTH
jgi:type IV pilus assembly protein PilX